MRSEPRRAAIFGRARTLPTLRHQLVCQRVGAALHGYLRALGLENTMFYGPADISWSEDDLVQPDILIVIPEDLSDDWRTFKRLRLVVEILSPSSRRADRAVKRRLYQENRVETYWVVDLDQDVVEIWHPGDASPLRATDTLSWRVSAVAPELSIPLAGVFKRMS